MYSGFRSTVFNSTVIKIKSRVVGETLEERTIDADVLLVALYTHSTLFSSCSTTVRFSGLAIATPAATDGLLEEVADTSSRPSVNSNLVGRQNPKEDRASSR